MSLLVLLGFKSSGNADLFLNNPNYNAPLQATQAKVNQGYTPPPPNQGLYTPGSSNPGVSPDGWVIIYVDTLPQIPPLYQPLVQLIVDTSNNNIIYNSPNIDTTTINLTTPDSTIFQNGVPPPTDNTPQSPIDNKLPFNFQPIYPDTSIQPTLDKPNYYDIPQVDLPALPDLFDPNLTDLYFYPRDINPEPWTFQYDNRTDIQGPQESRQYYTPETPGDIPGLIIPTPRSFDPGMDTAKHRRSLRQPISDSGEGGGSALGVYGVHFNGATGLKIPSLSTLGTSKISFSVWIRTAWTDSNPPLFIVDPGNNSVPNLNNNDPQVEAVGGGGGFNNILLSSGNQVPDGSHLDFAKVVVTSANNVIFANQWQHFMGTVDGTTNLGVFLVNGTSTGTFFPNASTFNTSPTNGKPLYIGLDTLLDFFTGDVFALGIWLDVSFMSGSSIPQGTINLFYNGGIPIIPFGGAAAFGPPTAFLTGPASRALISPILGTQQLFYSQGLLSNSTVPVVLGA